MLCQDEFTGADGEAVVSGGAAGMLVELPVFLVFPYPTASVSRVPISNRRGANFWTA